MLFRTRFRERALEAQLTRSDIVDSRLQVTAPHEWLLVSGLGVALAVLLAYGLVWRVERSLSVETVLVRPGERSDVVAAVAGVVVEVLVDVGDAVAAGQPIARVRTPEAQAWGAVLRSLRESTDSADARLNPAAESLPALIAAVGSGAALPGAGGFATQNIATPYGGELVMLALAAGRPVAVGELAARVRAASAGPLEALGFVTREEAMRVVPGMPAQVRLVGRDTGAIPVLPARVEEVSPRIVEPPRWLTEFGLDPPARSHLLRATLTDPEPQPVVVDGAGGALRIVLGHSSLSSLLFGRADD